ncbi:MAG: DNA-binding response regulator VicR [Candidatus Saccharibacteria bacterium]|jgi:CheY-like chemotaxis protein|nr:DNA-binding response regulator VicR [Candidatus Saccharibacteria bacterium]
MRKILLVEDEPILRETYGIILSTQPYETDYAENGKDALELCKNKQYDLILLDVMMPVMGGVEFIKSLDNLDEMKSKIIVMSNLSSGKEVEEAAQLGIQKHLLKSDISPSQLISEIRYYLEA